MATEPVVTKTTDPSGNAVTTKIYTDTSGNTIKEVTTDYGEISYGKLFVGFSKFMFLLTLLLSFLLSYLFYWLGLKLFNSLFGVNGYLVLALLYVVGLGFSIYSFATFDRKNIVKETSTPTMIDGKSGTKTTITGNFELSIYSSFIFRLSSICLNIIFSILAYKTYASESAGGAAQAGGGRRKKSRR